MKQILQVFLIGILLNVCLTVLAQAPQAFNYQAILRDGNGQPLQNEVANITINIHEGANTGNPTYTENHEVTTNDMGQVTFQVGKGTTTGDFSSINWGTNTYFVEVQLANETMGTVQLVSVPYALYADKAKVAESVENNAITSEMIKDGTIQATDIAEGVIPQISGDNVFLGERAGEYNTGINNTFVGSKSGQGFDTEMNTGSYNVFIGKDAGENNITGEDNVFIGYSSGESNQEGSSNVFLGRLSGRYNTTGYMNTFIGDRTGEHNIAGGENVYIGDDAGENIETGNRNVFIGKGAGKNMIGGEDNIFIGYNAGPASGTGISDALFISNRSTNSPLIYGAFSNKIIQINGDLTVTGTASKPGGGNWSTSSDRRLKNIKGNYQHSLKELEQINTILYSYKKDNPLNLPADTTFVGVIAQEIQKVIPEAVTIDEKGYLLVNNDPIIWAMLNAIQELSQELKEQKAVNQQLQTQVAKVEQLETTLNKLVKQVQTTKPNLQTSNNKNNY